VAGELDCSEVVAAQPDHRPKQVLDKFIICD